MDEVICDICGVKNAQGKRYCRECAGELTGPPDAAAASGIDVDEARSDLAHGAQDEQPQRSLCPAPGCGQPVDPGDVRCRYCGSALTDMATLTLVFPWGRAPLRPGQSVVLGRALGLPYTRELQPYDRVGRRHALLERLSDAVYLTDLESTNHTYVDGVPIARGARVQLAVGQTVGLSTMLRFRLEEDSA